MAVHSQSPHDPDRGTETPPDVFFNRRRWLKLGGLTIGAGALAGGGYWAWRQWQGYDQEVLEKGALDLQPESPLFQVYPAKRDLEFQYGRPETARVQAAKYTNFYEFSRYKWSWRLVDDFEPFPWTLTVDGHCRTPLTLDIEQFQRQYADDHTERQYRHRCVERWAMAVPWTGIPLARILKDADPTSKAKYVRFVSFVRPGQASNQQPGSKYPWPYEEGLTIDEAMAELTFLATGVYGQPLLKQHGAPIRLVVPWKYGFKSIKSIERIELVERQPKTFWNSVSPKAYGFEANVDPNVPRPWPQNFERMLGTGTQYPTKYLNGYSNEVGHLYKQA